MNFDNNKSTNLIHTSALLESAQQMNILQEQMNNDLEKEKEKAEQATSLKSMFLECILRVL